NHLYRSPDLATNEPRRVTCISEVIPAPDDQIATQTMFEFDEDTGTFQGASVESRWHNRLARSQYVGSSERTDASGPDRGDG
ncbi:MAG: hypothetical protein ACKPEY_07725, partial [Planctomycetota bacterium]